MGVFLLVMYHDQTICLILFLQGSIEGKRRRGRPRTQWQDNIVEWTSIGIEEAMRATRDRDRWKRIIVKLTAPLRHPNAMG